MKGDIQRHAPAALSREWSSNHYTEGWVNPRAGLNSCWISRPIGIRSLYRLARSELLDRLRSRSPP